MSYIEDNVLSADEKIITRAVISKVPLFWRWVWGVLGFWLLLVPTIKAIRYTIEYRCTEYVITNNKVIEKTGIVSVRCNEMNLDKMENVTISQSFWGRMFHYGTVVYRAQIAITFILSISKILLRSESI